MSEDMALLGGDEERHKMALAPSFSGVCRGGVVMPQTGMEVGCGQGSAGTTSIFRFLPAMADPHGNLRRQHARILNNP